MLAYACGLALAPQTHVTDALQSEVSAGALDGVDQEQNHATYLECRTR